MIPVQFGPFTRYNPTTTKRGLTPNELSRVENAQVSDQTLVMFPGWEEALGDDSTFDEKIIHMQEHVATGGSRYLCIHTATRFFVWDGGNLADRTATPIYNSGSTRWSSCSFGDLYIFTNGIDDTQFWDSSVPSVSAQPLTDAPKCKIVRSFASYVLAANIIDDTDSAASKLVKWCVSGDPTDWSTGDSGSIYVYEAEGDITDVQPLTRDMLVVYKAYSVHVMSLQTFPYTFVASSMISGTGVSSWRGVARVQNGHICLTNVGIRLFDGVNFTPVLDGVVDREVLQYHPNPNSAESIVYYLPMRSVVLVLLAGYSGYCETGFVLDMLSKSWSVLTQLKVSSVCLEASPTLSRTWDSMPGTWDSQSLRWSTAFAAVDEAFYVASFDGTDYRLCSSVKGNPVYTRDGNDYVGLAETGLVNPAELIWQKPLNKTELTQVFAGVDIGSPNVWIGVSETGVGGGEVRWFGPFTPDANGLVFTTLVGRFFMFRVEDDAPFKVTQITPYFVLRGVY